MDWEEATEPRRWYTRDAIGTVGFQRFFLRALKGPQRFGTVNGQRLWQRLYRDPRRLRISANPQACTTAARYCESPSGSMILSGNGMWHARRWRELLDAIQMDLMNKRVHSSDQPRARGLLK